MTDGIAWLAAPRSIAFGGYSVVMSRELASDELVSRLTDSVFGPRRRARSIGHLTGDQLQAVLDGVFDGSFTQIALRHGECGEWSFVVKYGGWQGEFGPEPPVSRNGAHIFELEYEEENGKPVPPTFAYTHDGRLMSAFNLHLDGSWGYDGVSGDPEVASALEERLTAAGLPDHELERRSVHRTSLEVLERHCGLSLPRQRILEEPLPSVFLRQL